MHPRYSSTVDSGNLAGHLMTLEHGLPAIPDEPIVNPRLFQGIADTFDVLCETGADSRHPGLTAFHQALPVGNKVPGTAAQARRSLLDLARHADAFLSASGMLPGSPPHHWALALRRQCQDAGDELARLAPWCQDAPLPPGNPELVALTTGIPTFKELAGYESSLHDIDVRGNDERSEEHTSELQSLMRISYAVFC